MQRDASMGTVILDGIPIATGQPSDGQTLTYSNANNQWVYDNLKVSDVFSAFQSGGAGQSAVAATDIDVSTDQAIEGTAISRVSPNTFSLQPGLYRIQFSFNKATFSNSGATEQILYQLFNQTDGLPFGPLGEASGFNPGSTVVCGVSMETHVLISVTSNVSVRIDSVSGSNPVIVGSALNIYKLD